MLNVAKFEFQQLSCSCSFYLHRPQSKLKDKTQSVSRLMCKRHVTV